jgi:heat shock protein HslJ
MLDMNRTIVLFAALVMALGVGCHSASHDASDHRGSKSIAIEDVDWRLINLRATPVEPAPAGTRAPQLRLIPEGARVTGYTGVNDFNGSYELSGNSLQFSPLAMTKRSALPPLMRLEESFVDALHETHGWRPYNEDIELLDAAGQPLARFTRSAP